ncbi:MAG TPA: hypothetical protein VGE51_11000 [Fontimonas sp.]
MRRTVTLTGLLMLASAAQAAEPLSCRNGLFPSAVGPVRAASVHVDKGARAHLRSDDAGCPADARCVTKSFLIGGDKVLVAGERDGYSCVWYFGKQREFVGWLPSASLTAAPQRVVALADWVGTWQPIAGDNEIRIAPKDPALLDVQGNATWVGGADADAPVVHEGELAGEGRPDGELLQIGSDDMSECMVKMQHVGGSLVVRDNGLCGGLNVRFDDVYRRTSNVPATIPADAQAVIDRVASCFHFSGEINGDGSERDREVLATMRELRCETIDQDEAALRGRYPDNAAIRRALDAATEL